jgi:hypothetical protein
VTSFVPRSGTVKQPRSVVLELAELRLHLVEIQRDSLQLTVFTFCMMYAAIVVTAWSSLREVGAPPEV